MENILAQAKRYGEQIRLLEDRRMEIERAAVRRAWVAFRRQLVENPTVELAAMNAYYYAYAK